MEQKRKKRLQQGIHSTDDRPNSGNRKTTKTSRDETRPLVAQPDTPNSQPNAPYGEYNTKVLQITAK